MGYQGWISAVTQVIAIGGGLVPGKMLGKAQDPADSISA